LGYEGEVEVVDVEIGVAMEAEVEVEVVEVEVALELGLMEVFDFRGIALAIERIHAHLSYSMQRIR
jgi:hypothetical protein